MLIPSIQSRRRWLVTLLLCVIGLELYFNFSFKDGIDQRVKWIDKSFGRLSLPLEYLVAELQSGAVGSLQSVSELLQAKTENQKLRDQLRDQALDLHRLEELRLENERLKMILGFRESQPLKYLAAKIIGRDPSSFYRTLIIDRGVGDGLEEQMPVVSPQGLVGYVFQTSQWSSRVLLINDVNSTVDAVVQRSRTRAIVGGALDGSLILKFLPRRQDIEAGDRLVTSGLGGRYPSGFEIGKVLSIRRDPHHVLEEVVVEPAVDFDSIEEVLIVLKPSKSKG